MPPPSQRKVYCAFADGLKTAFPVGCTINHDTYDDLKAKIQQKKRLHTVDIDRWILYSPGRVLDKEQPFIPSPKDSRLPSKFLVEATNPESSDPEVDVVVMVGDQPAFLKRSVYEFFTSGNILCPSASSERFANSKGLPYSPPSPGSLVNSPGRQWDYQASPELTEVLHDEVKQHFDNYVRQYIDKTTIPLYLFLSGAGTGKSRNAAELDKTIYKCFDGTYFDENQQLVSQLQSPFVFHVSLETGTSLREEEGDPWKAIGARMLLQILQNDVPRDKKLSVNNITSMWHPPTPDEIIQLLSPAGSSALEKRTVILVVDGLHNISTVFGEYKMLEVLTNLGDLAHRGFIIVCGTSTVSGPFDRLLAGSRRRRIPLLCSPLDPPRINDKPVFSMDNVVQQVLVSDCGGPGRAFEFLLKIFQMLPGDVSCEVKHVIAQKLQILYSGVLPSENDSVAIIKAVLANKCLPRYAPIPGTQVTPDEVCQNGLIRFTSENTGSNNPVGYFKVPYIWLLILCLTYKGNRFFQEFQLLDYRDFRSKQDPTLPGGFSLADFEKLMVKVRKIKSHMFEDGQKVTLGELHQGAIMGKETETIAFNNRHLNGDVAVHRIQTKTTRNNEHSWVIETSAGQVYIRLHKHIILNGTSAPDGDAVLSLDSTTPRTETHQYKHLRKGSFDFNKEKNKAAGTNDIFALFCTSSIPRLRDNNRYHIPPRSILVAKDNWDSYFGPYASRSYLFAKETCQRSEEAFNV